MLGQMLDHRYTARHASEYLDGELSHAGCQRVERHASMCPGCHALLASLRRLVGELPGLAAPGGSAVAGSVLERLQRED